MTSSNPSIIHFEQESIEDLNSNFLQFQKGVIILKKVVFGRIVNSVPSPNDKENQLEWKRTVAKSVYLNKTSELHSPKDYYAISLNMRFNIKNHHAKKLDVENYVKPIVDAIAMGLFSHGIDLDKITKFDADDSNFHHLYIERSNDVSNPTEEGVVIVVSKIKKHTTYD